MLHSNTYKEMQQKDTYGDVNMNMCPIMKLKLTPSFFFISKYIHNNDYKQYWKYTI